MEKKKLNDTEIDVGMTDEEIIKAFEEMYVLGRFRAKAIKKALALIYRLQDENAELKAKRKKILANRVYSDATLKSWEKEDLIEQIRILEHNWAAAEESLDIQAKNCEMLLKQAEKDTAKEILEELDLFFKGTTFRKGYEFKKIEAKLKEIAKSKGVEVE